MSEEFDPEEIIEVIVNEETGEILNKEFLASKIPSYNPEDLCEAEVQIKETNVNWKIKDGPTVQAIHSKKVEHSSPVVLNHLMSVKKATGVAAILGNNVYQPSGWGKVKHSFKGKEVEIWGKEGEFYLEEPKEVKDLVLSSEPSEIHIHVISNPAPFKKKDE